jgi:hypothetical protein
LSTDLLTAALFAWLAAALIALTGRGMIMHGKAKPDGCSALP